MWRPRGASWERERRGAHRARTAHPDVVHHLRDLVRGSVRHVVPRRGPTVGSQDDSTVVHARHDRGLFVRGGNGGQSNGVVGGKFAKRRPDLGGNVFLNTGRAGAHPGGHLLHQFGRHAERCGNAVIHRVRLCLSSKPVAGSASTRSGCTRRKSGMTKTTRGRRRRKNAVSRGGRVLCC